MKSAQRIVLAVTLLFFARPAAATISYHISLKNPEQHLFHVRMQIPAAAADQEIVVALPAWNALYQVRDFSYRVRDVRASNSATPAAALPIRHARQANLENFASQAQAADSALPQAHRHARLQHRMGRSRSVQFAIERAPRLPEFRRSADVPSHATRRRRPGPV